MFCIECGELLSVIPLYNNGEDELYPPNLPFCANPNCKRHGFITIVFNSSEKLKKGKKGEKS